MIANYNFDLDDEEDAETTTANTKKNYRQQ